MKRSISSRGVAKLRFVLSMLVLSGGMLGAEMIASDYAHDDAYIDGWNEGTNGGYGFEPWLLYASTVSAPDQHAGFFLADAEVEADLNGAATLARSFGSFANGVGFEETIAVRTFEYPLEPGDIFSCKFEFDGFEAKFEGEEGEIASVGLALRAGRNMAQRDELANNSLFTLCVLNGLSTYQIFDGSGRFNTRVFVDPAGVELTVEVLTEETYNLTLRTISESRVFRLDNRSFLLPERSGEAPDIEGLAFFNFNGGRNNAYLDALVIEGP